MEWLIRTRSSRLEPEAGPLLVEGIQDEPWPAQAYVSVINDAAMLASEGRRPHSASASQNALVRRAARHVLTIVLTVLLGSLLGATLVRIAPGFGTDDRQLDARLSQQSIQALLRSRDADRNTLHFYARYLGGLFHGNLGVSRSLGRPVTALLAERLPVTFRSISIGLMEAWLLGIALALPSAVFRDKTYDLLSTLVCGLFLCVPSAVLAILFLVVRGPAPLAIALAVFPKIFRYTRNLLVQTYALPHVVTARAKGLRGTRILLWHVLPSAAPQILALAGVSVSTALGAAIPIEVICDSPGIGQLAWIAALGRDLPLLVNLTGLVTFITLLANSASDLAIAASTPHPL